MFILYDFLGWVFKLLDVVVLCNVFFLRFFFLHKIPPQPDCSS